MFLTEADLEQMTGLRRGKNRPSTLRKWLEENDKVEGVDFFRRHDGWYSVLIPVQRTTEEPRPKLRLQA